MKKIQKAPFAIVVFLLITSVLRAEPMISSITLFEKNGGRLDVMDTAPYYIAFDRKGADGFYDTWYTNPQRTFTTCINCNHPDFPTRNVGQPAWDPTGRYLLLQVEKQVHKEALAKLSQPGLAVYNDLYVYDFVTNRATALVVLPDSPDYAVLHPHFSPDGKRVTWGEMYSRPENATPELLVGKWKLGIADYDTKGARPVLRNIKYIIPSIPTWYEDHGFTVDGTRLIFTSPFLRFTKVAFSNEYTYDLATGDIQQLTTTGYNEHAHMSPDERYYSWLHISWLFNNPTGFALPGNLPQEKMCQDKMTTKIPAGELWMMKTDGTQKTQMTSFSTPGSPMQYCETSAEGKCCFTSITADNAWMGPKELFLFVQFPGANYPEQIYRVLLK